MLINPASRARRHSSFAGNVSAVALVMWLMKITRVRGVTPPQNCSTKSSCVVTGKGMGRRA